MSAILKIAGIMLAIYWISSVTDNSYIFSGSSGILWLGGISCAVYALFRNTIKPSSKNNEQSITAKANVVINKEPAANNKNKWIYGFLTVMVLVYLMQDFLGRMSFRFFLFMDNTLRLTDSIHPIVMWAMLGSLTGLIYGSFVAWKKYKLDFKLNLIPLGIFLLIIFLLIMVNEPLDSEPINNEMSSHELTTENTDNVSLKKFIINRWQIADVIGKNRDSFLRKKNNTTDELEFKKNGKCYFNKNGISVASRLYTIAPDGKSLILTRPDNANEIITIEIISITKDKLVVRSAIYENDTVTLKAE